MIDSRFDRRLTDQVLEKSGEFFNEAGELNEGCSQFRVVSSQSLQSLTEALLVPSMLCSTTSSSSTEATQAVWFLQSDSPAAVMSRRTEVRRDITAVR